MTTDLLDRPTVPVDDLTRRELITGALAAGLLAGCGARDQATEPAAPAEPATRTVETRFGPMEVPIDPRRVVTLEGRRDLDIVLSLELPLIGYGYQDYGLGEFIPGPLQEAAREAAAAEPLFPANQENIELLASLRPDLFVGRESNVEGLLAELTAIAPALPVGSGPEPWQDDLRFIAEATGRSDRAREVLAGYDAALDALRRRHRAKLGTVRVAVVNFFSGKFGASGPRGFYLQAQTLTDLGGRLVEAQMSLGDGPDSYSDFSVERTDELLEGADVIVLITATEEERQQVEDNPLWERHPAVAAGKVVETNSQLNYGGPLTAMACVELLDQAYELAG